MTNLRYALRSLRKSPGFVVIAVLALGIGLGLSTTMFGVLDAVIHPYVPYRNPDQLFSVHWWMGRHNARSSAEMYRYFRDNTHSFEGVAAMTWANATIELKGGDYRDIALRLVSPRYYSLVGVQPRLGRALTNSDGDNVAVLSDPAWTSLFGKRRRLDGATITLNRKPVTVVGVMPRGTDFGVMMALPPEVETGGGFRNYVQPIVRLKRGVTQAQAEDELKHLAEVLTAQSGDQRAPYSFGLTPLVSHDENIHDIHKAMVGSALFVLIIACVNLAHLLMARGLAKRREVALRMALGASRATVVRQMFLECAIITVAGAAAGALIAYWGVDLLANRMPPEVGWVGLVKPQLSWRVFTLGGLIAAVSAIGFGLVPALQVVSGVNLDDPLKDDTGTTTGRVRHRYNPLVVTEVALALVLMMGAGLLLRTVHGLQQEREDNNEETLWQGMIYLPQADSGVAPTPAPEMLAIIKATPGVVDVATATDHPLLKAGNAIIGEQTEDSTRYISTRTYEVVSPSYLKVRALPILRGRDFEPGDAAGSGVAVIDALAAQKLYPGVNAVGHMLKLGGPASNGPWIPIVGVSRSPIVLQGDERLAPDPQVWIAMTDSSYPESLVFRSSSPDPGLLPLIRNRTRDLAVIRLWLAPWNYNRKTEIASRAFLAKVFATMGAVALGLSALGLYGVLAYAVTRRMREFAVRVALGCEPWRLRRQVLHDGFVMLLAGIGVGAFAALAMSRYLDSVLIAILPSDVISLAVSEVVLIGVGLAAALAPARRASRANPMDILRAT